MKTAGILLVIAAILTPVVLTYDFYDNTRTLEYLTLEMEKARIAYKGVRIVYEANAHSGLPFEDRGRLEAAGERFSAIQNEVQVLEIETRTSAMRAKIGAVAALALLIAGVIMFQKSN